YKSIIERYKGLKNYIVKIQENQNNQTYWNYVFLEYNEYVNNIIRRYIFEKQYQSDVLQETWLKIFKSIKLYNSKKPFKTWLYTVTKHVCFTWLKNNIKSNVLTNALNVFNFEDLEYVLNLSSQNEFENNLIIKDALNRALLSVKNPKAALAFKLKILNNLSINEISKVIKTPVVTVKNWVYRDVPNIIRPILSKNF
ncbi:MAG: sigma-70 family RNA polymerase sigma factor, partial [Clostridiales bacterium]